MKIVTMGLIALFITFGWLAKAQELKIKSVTTRGGDIIVKYDLLDNDLTHKYTLSLYASSDDYVQPLENVSGDIGIDIAVGGSKQVTWRAKEELGELFAGNVTLELKGKLYIPFVELYDFENIDSFKRGRPYNLTWSAGRGNDVLTIDLFNDDKEIVHTFTNVANVGEYILVIPKDIKPGKDYRLRFTDQKNKDDVVYTTNFSVKRKIPFVLQAAVGASVAGAGYLVLTNAEGAAPAGESDIPGPVLPTN
ncbi:MAG: Ser-Thr-rich GPI-anchored membrane family protein [Marinoscillum sp.]